MSDQAARVVLIANPQAGRGRVGRWLPHLTGRLEERGRSCRILLTERAGHAGELTEAALHEGERLLVAVGGDGTVNEVVNAMLLDDRPIADDAVLGVLPGGSGCDFARSFGLPNDVEGAVAYLSGGRPQAVDVGKITFQTETTGLVSRYFVNVAEVGLGAANVARAERLPRWLGRARYLVSFWLTIGPYEPVGISVSATGQAFEGVAHNVVLANGRFFGGGMRISPKSDPTDGILDVQVSIGPKSQAFTLLPKIYAGKHLPNERIVEMSGSTVRIDAQRQLPIEADGEILGVTPAIVIVLPGAIRLLIPHSPE